MWRRMGVYGCLVLVPVLALAFGWRAFVAYVNPVLIINEDPSATVLVDGESVFAKGATGSYLLNPWRDSYVVEVRSRSGIERRTIFPHHEESDSGSIGVDKEGVSFSLKSTPLQ